LSTRGCSIPLYPPQKKGGTNNGDKKLKVKNEKLKVDKEMKSKRILTLITGLLMACFGAVVLLGAVDYGYGLDGNLVKFWPVAPAIFCLAQLVPDQYAFFLPKGSLYADAAVATLFAKTLEEKVFPTNEFYTQSQDDTAFVQQSGDGEKVVYGVSGDNPGTAINRTLLPATIIRRVDDSNEYPLKEFTTDPSLITITEESIVHYAKRASMLRNHAETLNTLIADYFANLWLPDGAANIVRTSGSTTRTASAPSATGTRKRLVKADLISALEKLNRMDAPMDGRNMLIPAEFLSDLLTIDDFIHADKIGSGSALVTGSIGKLLGINIFVRSNVGIYDDTATPVKKALGAAGAATDHLAALVWVDKWVTRAKGSTFFLLDEKKPEYYGDIFSTLVRAGGKTRKDLKGVIAIVETD
jgi:hypothetical protein